MTAPSDTHATRQPISLSRTRAHTNCSSTPRKQHSYTRSAFGHVPYKHTPHVWHDAAANSQIEEGEGVQGNYLCEAKTKYGIYASVM